MGQFEKIVVLIVFLVVTVIFVVALNPSEEGEFAFDMEARRGELAEVEEAPLPAASDLSVVDRGRGENPWRKPSSRGGPLAAEGQGQGMTLQERLQADERRREEAAQRPDLLLDAGTALASDSSRLPEGSVLITTEGLLDSWDPDIKEYVWRKKDTFVALAERFYGDREMAPLLRQFNEGISYTKPGEKILVPVFDRRGAVADTSASTSTPPNSDLSPKRAGSTYTVVDGDSLWVISKKVYGKGSRWEEIYDANTALLASPDDVSVGMELLIP